MGGRGRLQDDIHWHLLNFWSHESDRLQVQLRPAICIIGSFSNDDRDGNVNAKKQSTTLHVQHACFCTFLSMTLLNDYDVKMPNFTFYGMEDGNKLATKKFSLFQNSSAVPKKSTPVKFAYIKYFQ